MRGESLAHQFHRALQRPLARIEIINRWAAISSRLWLAYLLRYIKSLRNMLQITRDMITPANCSTLGKVADHFGEVRVCALQALNDQRSATRQDLGLHLEGNEGNREASRGSVEARARAHRQHCDDQYQVSRAFMQRRRFQGEVITACNLSDAEKESCGIPPDGP